MIRGSGGSKSKLAKAAGAEPCAQSRYPKSYTAVAQSTFPNQTAQNTTGAFFEVQMSKNCTPLSAEHVSKSKCTKYLLCEALLEVSMSQRCPTEEL